METEKRLLTKIQVAGRLGVRPDTVAAWQRRGLIPSIRAGKRVIRFEWDAVLSALRSEAAVTAGPSSTDPHRCACCGARRELVGLTSSNDEICEPCSEYLQRLTTGGRGRR